jgi:MFS family permease
MFIQEERAGVLALINIPALAGLAVAPIIGGYIREALGWRWVFWLGAIVEGATAAQLSPAGSTVSLLFLLIELLCKHIYYANSLVLDLEHPYVLVCCNDICWYLNDDLARKPGL